MFRSLLLMAAFSVTWTELAAAAITFTAQSPTRGHRIHQTVDVRTTANVVFEQSQQVIFDEHRDERNRQQRDVEVLETGPDLPTLARVTYAKATTKELNQLGHRARPQPVAGKTYLVARVDGELQVTYPEGRQPPRDEWAIVAANMRSLGKPNPLAQFLNGRTVQIGEQLTLPPHIAKELLGESVRFQEADRITLRLCAERRYHSQSSGWFDIEISQARTPDGHYVACHGKIVLSSSTCQTLHMEVDAEFDVTEERGPAGATFLVHHRGTASIEMDARHEPSGSIRTRLLPVAWPLKAR